jgi:hypothetical protein
MKRYSSSLAVNGSETEIDDEGNLDIPKTFRIPASDLCGVMYADGRGDSNDKAHIKVKIYN